MSTFPYLNLQGGSNMDIRNCRICGKIYAYDGFDICLSCRRKEDEEFKKVKAYIYDNPNASIQEVSEGTGVSVKKILRFLREGKLELKDENINLILDCERCGAPIKTGRFCDKCKIELERELRASISNNVNKRGEYEKGEMYTAHRHINKNK